MLVTCCFLSRNAGFKVCCVACGPALGSEQPRSRILLDSQSALLQLRLENRNFQVTSHSFGWQIAAFNHESSARSTLQKALAGKKVFSQVRTERVQIARLLCFGQGCAQKTCSEDLLIKRFARRNLHRALFVFSFSGGRFARRGSMRNMAHGIGFEHPDVALAGAPHEPR